VNRQHPHASAWGFFMCELSDLGQRLCLWADDLHAIANEGLHWVRENPTVGGAAGAFVRHAHRIADAFRSWRGERREAVFDKSSKEDIT